MLNKQMIQSLSLSQDLNSVCVTIFNKCCHHINQLQIQHFAETHEQSIYMSLTKYTHIKKVQDVLKIDELLATQNEEDTAKESDLFLYTQEMSITILFNICTSLELINEVRDTAADIVLNSNDKLLIYATRAKDVLH